MSLGAVSIGEVPLAAQPMAATSSGKPPPKRTTVAKADTVAQPEPR